MNDVNNVCSSQLAVAIRVSSGCSDDNPTRDGEGGYCTLERGKGWRVHGQRARQPEIIAVQNGAFKLNWAKITCCGKEILISELQMQLRREAARSCRLICVFIRTIKCNSKMICIIWRNTSCSSHLHTHTNRQTDSRIACHNYSSTSSSLNHNYAALVIWLRKGVACKGEEGEWEGSGRNCSREFCMHLRHLVMPNWLLN